LEKDVMSEKLFEETKLSDDELKVADMYHFVMFHLNPIKANVTFIANPDPNATGGYANLASTYYKYPTDFS
jgi:hypothetical protein